MKTNKLLKFLAILVVGFGFCSAQTQSTEEIDHITNSLKYCNNSIFHRDIEQAQKLLHDNLVSLRDEKNTTDELWKSIENLIEDGDSKKSRKKLLETRYSNLLSLVRVNLKIKEKTEKTEYGKNSASCSASKTKKLVPQVGSLFLQYKEFNKELSSLKNANDDSVQNKITNVSKIFSGSGTLLGQDSGLRDYISFTDQINEEKGEYHIRFLADKVTYFIKRAVAPVAVIFLVFSGIQLYLAGGSGEEVFKRKKDQIIWTGVGFIIFAMTTHLVDYVFFGTRGQALDSAESVKKYALQGVMEAQGLYEVVMFFVVGIAVGFIVLTAIKLVIAAGEDESQISKAKKRISFTSIGIIVLISIKPILALMSNEGKLSPPDPEAMITFGMKWANLLLSFVAFFAVIALIYGGVRLIVDFGKGEAQEKAKKIIIGALIGLVLTFSSWTIVHFFVDPGDVSGTIRGSFQLED